MITARYSFKIEQQTPLEEGVRYNQGKNIAELFCELEYAAVLRIIQGIINEAITENSKQITPGSFVRSSEIGKDSAGRTTL